MRSDQIPELETTEVKKDKRQNEKEINDEVTRESMLFNWAVEVNMILSLSPINHNPATPTLNNPNRTLPISTNHTPAAYTLATSALISLKPGDVAPSPDGVTLASTPTILPTLTELVNPDSGKIATYAIHPKSAGVTPIPVSPNPVPVKLNKLTPAMLDNLTLSVHVDPDPAAFTFLLFFSSSPKPVSSWCIVYNDLWAYEV